MCVRTYAQTMAEPDKTGHAMGTCTRSVATRSFSFAISHCRLSMRPTLWIHVCHYERASELSSCMHVRACVRAHYIPFESASDKDGHGSHTAATQRAPIAAPVRALCLSSSPALFPAPSRDHAVVPNPLRPCAWRPIEAFHTWVVCIPQAEPCFDLRPPLSVISAAWSWMTAVQSQQKCRVSPCAQLGMEGRVSLAATLRCRH